MNNLLLPILILAPGVLAQTTSLVSLSTNSVQANLGPSGSHPGCAISADGRWVAFASNANNLLDGGLDTNGVADVFVRDRLLQTTTRVSVASNGEQANSFSGSPSISADGRYVAFESFATNLDSERADTNGTFDVFVHDRQTGATRRVSVSSLGQEAVGTDGNLLPLISADGRFVAFQSRAGNLVAGDTNGQMDVFVHELATGATTRVSVASGGVQHGNGGEQASISGDGRYVAFVADFGLIPRSNGPGSDIYVHDRLTLQTERVSLASPGGSVLPFEGCRQPAISDDGSCVAFLTSSRLVATDTIQHTDDVYVRDRVAGTTERVSVATNGAQNTNLSVGSGSPDISADGRWVIWWHGFAGFVPDDTNGGSDVYLRDRQNSTTSRVSLTHDGLQANGPSMYAVLSADGRSVAFQSTAMNLVPGGTNGVTHFFVRDGHPTNSPPIANAGDQFSVNEAQPVMLDGSGSSDPDNDLLTYSWAQIGGPQATLSDSTAVNPTFTAPLVAIGGATLTFQLTVTANGASDTDTVSVTVVNVNHPPVADAGYDQSIAEGSPVTLHGEASFDIDADAFTYAWVQVGGPVVPAVTLVGADTKNPTFTAPYYGTSGAPGVVATLVFQLTVADGFPADAPAPGYTFAHVVDTVTVAITNVNNAPSADAGTDQTVDENSAVALSGAASSDPDSDPLTHAWVQVGGPVVILDGATTAAPSFLAPFVGVGGADLTFALTVDDGYGGIHTDTVVVHVQNANDAPLADAARPTVAVLWPPNHRMVEIGITGVTDPDNDATIVVTGVRQDEPTNGTGDGDTAIDAIINANGTVLLRAERAGNGDGRVYHIYFTASDLEGSVSGVVTVSVPHQIKTAAIDGGPLFDSTN